MIIEAKEMVLQLWSRHPFMRIWQSVLKKEEENADSRMGPKPNHNFRGHSEAQATFQNGSEAQRMLPERSES